MRTEVTAAIDELKRQFPESAFTVSDDGQGGAHVLMEPVVLGARYEPESTWFGFQIPAQYPYADIYPVFMGAKCRRKDGVGFSAPVTLGHNFRGRAAIQISRRSGAAQNGGQKATAKLLKVLDFLRTLP
jgi:hypothetical protein